MVKKSNRGSIRKESTSQNSDEDHNIYVKRSGRYEPIGYWFESQHDWLTEGVWIVTKRPGCSSTTNGEYAKKIYGLDKVCDIEMPSYSELAGFHKYMQYVADEITWDDLKGKSLSDVLSYIAGKMYITNKKLAKDKLVKVGGKSHIEGTQSESKF